jgi:CheY-like chemotaxis protein
MNGAEQLSVSSGPISRNLYKGYSMNKHQLAILLIDDDDVAVESTQRNLKKCGVHFPIYTACNGQEGLMTLRGKSRYGTMPRELVVLLDLNMPVKNGFEFLEELRNDPELRSTVVFVLTTSDTDIDRTRAYHNCIAGYMVKSALGSQFVQLAALLNVYDSSVSFS